MSDGWPVSDEDVVEDPDALRAAERAVRGISNSTEGPATAIGEQSRVQVAAQTALYGVPSPPPAVPTPVTGVGRTLSDNELISRLAEGRRPAVGMVIAVLAGVLAVAAAVALLLRG